MARACAVLLFFIAICLCFFGVCSGESSQMYYDGEYYSVSTHIIHGNVTATPGAIIEARVPGVMYSSYNPAKSSDGKYTIAVDGNITMQDTIEFYVDGFKAEETTRYLPGVVTKIDLTVPEYILSEPTPTVTTVAPTTATTVVTTSPTYTYIPTQTTRRIPVYNPPTQTPILSKATPTSNTTTTISQVLTSSPTKTLPISEKPNPYVNVTPLDMPNNNYLIGVVIMIIGIIIIVVTVLAFRKKYDILE